ncbi:MAG: translesion error-prone DNA polymerase V autoproteolytic subunit [Candidatus Kapabacteria bacterium]|nr:translesion error-prone DNA polymerase V autoproteolytic subunit [Candidatus Kapabacteria bacterium]
MNKNSKLKKVEIENVVVTDIFKPIRKKEEYIPIFLESVSAGFPSPADDYLEGRLDLNEYLVRNPSATFFLRVTGDSMIDAGIHSGDILIVDRSLTPRSGSIVIAAIDGELVVKRLKISKNKIFLIPENRQYEPIEIKSEMNFEVWGVVTSVIHSLT